MKNKTGEKEGADEVEQNNKVDEDVKRERERINKHRERGPVSGREGKKEKEKRENEKGKKKAKAKAKKNKKE